MFSIILNLWCNTNLFEKYFLRYKNLKVRLRVYLFNLIRQNYNNDNSKIRSRGGFQLGISAH